MNDSLCVVWGRGKDQEERNHQACKKKKGKNLFIFSESHKCYRGEGRQPCHFLSPILWYVLSHEVLQAPLHFLPTWGF